MKILICIIVFAVVAFTPLLAMPQASAPSKAGVRAMPTTSPTPTPTPTPKPLQTIAPAANQPKAAPGAPNTAAPGPVVARPTPGTPNTTAPGAVVARPATPAQAPPLLGGAPAFGTPDHSPDQFDFGEVWDGDLARKTFHLTTTAAGYVSVQLPQGPFRVAEFREMGAIQQGTTKNAGNKPSNQPLVPLQPVKSKITYLEGQSGPFQWSLAAGVDIQIDIAFQPHFNLMSEIAGQKAATMKVTGPGPHGDWTFTVPLRGMFDGLKLTAQIVPDPKDVYAVTGDPNTWTRVRVIGLDRSVTGTLRAEGTLPPGVSVVPTQVTVPAKQTVAAVLPINYGTFPGDMTPRTIHLVFDDGSQKSTAQIQFTALPRTVQLYSHPRADCGIATAELTITLSAPDAIRLIDNQGKALSVQQPHRTLLDFEFRGRNLDLIDRRYVWIVAEVDGVGVFGDAFTLNEHDATETIVKKSGRPSAFLDYEAWARLLGGHVQFGCQLSELPGSPKVLNLKWAAGDLHVQ